MQARETLLLNEGILWVKKDGNGDFDVLVVCFNDAEVCELVGSYIFQQLNRLFEHHSVGLCRYDNLAIMKSLVAPGTERIKRKVIKIFKNYGLKITTKPNLHIANFLDITLDLRNSTNEPYRKLDNHSVYINKNSNYPKKFKKTI